MQQINASTYQSSLLGGFDVSATFFEKLGQAMDSLRRVRVRLANRISPLLWIKVPSTFDELLYLCCSSLKCDQAGSILTLKDATVDSLDILENDDLLELHRASDQCSELEEWIQLNVGGVRFSTTRLTLTSTEPNSIFAKLLQDDRIWNRRIDADGSISIDRSGRIFEILLNYLRTRRLVASDDVSLQNIFNDAQYYGFDNLLRELQPHVNAYSKSESILFLGKSRNSITLSRSDVIRALMTSPSSLELRFQGIDFEGCDLSKLDLRNINFRMCNLKGVNLSYANLSFANLERADLSDANLDYCVMFAVKMPGATMERASLVSVNMDDPNGVRANLEGVNLKNAILDNSQLNGCNFRVANLKFASLKNCELKQASFPGANLEQCDLSCSNLFEANLRGANLVNTNFGHLANALHMSQTI